MFLFLFFLMLFPHVANAKSHYPNFDDNPHITRDAKELLRPFLIPLDHPVKPMLDAIFSSARVTKDKSSLAEAGFTTLYSQPKTHLEIVRHPDLQGYLLKLFLDIDLGIKHHRPGWVWLARRCKGAENVRRLIKKYKLKHITVPDKWIYILPVDPSAPNAPEYTRHIAVLLVTDMDLVTYQESAYAWKNFVTHKQIEELFCIIDHGYSSSFLANNIPYCRNGKFSCIDTEHPKRKPHYQRVEQFLSPEMVAYWRTLVEMAGDH